MSNQGKRADEVIQNQWPFLNERIFFFISPKWQLLWNALTFSTFILLAMGCEAPVSQGSEELSRQFQASGRSFVNLAEVFPFPWDKVCIFGPYSDGKAVTTVLGFDWPDFGHSSIEHNDRVGLLVFVKGKSVVKWIEHPRKEGDFTNLSRQCIPREYAIFKHLTNPPKGFPGLFPQR